jgi:diketogulonate reductase-like aldo/keto reductase
VLEIIANQDIARFIRVSNVPVRMRYNMWTSALYPISPLQIKHYLYLVQPDLVTLAKIIDIIVTAYFSFSP